MKSYPSSFGFEAFLIYFIPGAIVLIALLLILMNPVACNIVVMNDMCSQFPAVMHGKNIKDAEFIVFTLSVVISGFFGCIVAVAANYQEVKCLDKIAAKKVWQQYSHELEKIGIKEDGSEDFFVDVWHWYITNLNSFRNSYVTKMVLRLHFTTRIGLAAVVMFCALIIVQQIVLAIFVLFVAIFLRIGAGDTSKNLAIYRLFFYLRENHWDSYRELVRERRDRGSVESVDDKE